jgi:uncharacterized protein YcbX
MTAGQLVSLSRYPVKSMAGEHLEALDVDARGAAGDRTHALLFFHKEAWKRLTARQASRLLAWSATYGQAAVDADDPPPPRLRDPGGQTHVWGDADLPAVLEADLGRRVRLRRDTAGQQDLARTLLLTTEASRAAVEAALGRTLDLRRFRPNLHVELDAPAYAEHAWKGRRLRVGAVELELLDPCVRCVIPTLDPDTQERWPELMRRLARERETCFGINARVARPGRLSVGDPVELVSRQP